MSTLTNTDGQRGMARPLGRRNLLMWSAATLALAGCADVNYLAPTADVAGKFDAAAPGRDTSPEARMWWRAFRDPQLDQLIAAGNARNLTLQQAIAAIDEAQASVASVNGNDLPQVQASAGAQRALSSDAAASGGAITTSTYITPSFSWLLDIFGANRNARKAAAAQLDAAYLSADVARLTIESSIATAYINLRYFQESIALTNRSIASRKRSLELTQTQFNLGSASKLDVLQADQLVAEGEATLPAYETGFDQSLAQLAMLTAQRSADLRARLTRSAPQPTARFKPSVGVPADVVRDRPDVRMAERTYAAAAYGVGVAKAAFYPSVSLSGSITPLHVSSPGKSSISYWAIGPAINLPIFTGGQNMANLKASESRAVQARLGWEQSVLKAIEEVESGLAAYNRDGRNIAAQQRLVNTSKETTDLSRSSYEIGEGTFINVLDSERAYLTAQQSLATAVRQQATDYVTLSVAAAGGTAR
uniref:efflux transporter outer membrane subunit n=1 Tax=Paenirhodobacter enshiensis TaxID=1105367 RepID=UPI0035B339AE